MIPSRRWFLIVAVGLLGVVVQAGLFPEEVPFLVNTVTTGLQRQPDVDLADDGSALVVWDTDATGQEDISGRLVAPDGSVIGNEFRINTSTSNSQIRPTVAGFPDSGFVVVWESYVYATGEDELDVQRVDATGALVGDEVRIDDTEFHLHADVAVTNDGGFVVVWDDEFDIFARRFDAAGSSIGTEFQVNGQPGTMYGPRISAAANGGFAVVWEDRSEIDGDGAGVLLRRFNSAGNPVGGDLQVNSTTTGDQYAPAVAVQDDGAFVVVWEAYGQDTVGDGAFGRVFDSAGSPVGAEFRVDSGTSAYAGYVDASTAVDGFAVVWNEPREAGGDVFKTLLRRFDDAGVGGEIIDVDAGDQGDQSDGVVAGRGDRVIVAWQGFGPDEQDIFAQRFDAGDATATPRVSTPTPTIPGGPTTTPVAGCAGDCDGTGAVSISELVRAVNIALGTTAVDSCRAADRNGNGIVAINELILAVNSALQGC